MNLQIRGLRRFCSRVLEQPREKFQRVVVVDSLQEISEFLQRAESFDPFSVKGMIFQAHLGQIDRSHIVKASQGATEFKGGFPTSQLLS
jgi:hypothetical protein